MRCLAQALILFVCANTAVAQQWGGVKGQVVWGGGAVPKPEEENVTTDKVQCLAKGKLLKDDLLIDATTNGIKDVFVWLKPAGNAPIAIHPNLKAIPAKAVEIDQPCCHFEPRAVGLRQGQTLVIKNSAKISHNAMFYVNKEINPTINSTITAGKELEVKGDKALKPERLPIKLACTIHPWMGARVGVFDHPYFAITDKDGNFEIKDAPTGQLLIYVWHERSGFLHKGGFGGQKLTITGDKIEDLGKIMMQ